MEQQQKFQRFEAAVYAEVDAKVEQIRASAAKEKDETLRQNKDTQLSKTTNLVRHKTQEIKRDCKREAAKYSLDCKRKILLKRKDLEEKVFSEVERRLAEYADSAEYPDWLLKRIEIFAEENSLPGAVIIVNERDFSSADKIGKAFHLPCTVEKNDAAVGVGGFIVRADQESIYFDETLAQRLAGQKTYFIENSGLSLA